MVTKSLSKELGRKVQVNSIAPGPILKPSDKRIKVYRNSFKEENALKSIISALKIFLNTKKFPVNQFQLITVKVLSLTSSYNFLNILYSIVLKIFDKFFINFHRKPKPFIDHPSIKLNGVSSSTQLFNNISS